MTEYTGSLRNLANHTLFAERIGSYSSSLLLPYPWMQILVRLCPVVFRLDLYVMKCSSVLVSVCCVWPSNQSISFIKQLLYNIIKAIDAWYGNSHSYMWRERNYFVWLNHCPLSWLLGKALLSNNFIFYSSAYQLVTFGSSASPWAILL